MILPLYIYFLFFCTLIAIIGFFGRPAPLYLKLFPFYLLVSIAVEFTGYWMLPRYGSNTVLFNFFVVFSFCFFQFVLRDIISDRLFKRFALVIILCDVLFGFYNIFFYQGLHTWNSVSYSFGCLVVVAFCIYYFLELFKKPKSTKLTNESAFWIVSGLLFFYCVSFPFLGLNNLLNSAPPLLMRNLNYILTVLNILLYILFTIAFLVRFRFKKHAV